MADNTLEGVTGGVEGINIPEGSVCIISMQLPTAYLYAQRSRNSFQKFSSYFMSKH